MEALFRTTDLGEWLSELESRALKEINNFEPRVIRAHPDRVIEQVINQFTVEPLDVQWGKITAEDARVVKVPRNDGFDTFLSDAYRVVLHVPYAGSKRLFQTRATTYSLGGKPEGDVSDTTLTFFATTANADAVAMHSAINQTQKRIQEEVGWVNQDIAPWKARMESRVVAAVNARKAALDAAASLTTQLEIPLHSVDSSIAVQVPVKRKAVRPTSGMTAAGVESEPAIADKIYQDVLRTLRHTGNSFERLPRTMLRFKEEELRDILLFILNSNYEGDAAGEVFNGDGKTDILIRFQDRNAFIGECKVWRGSKQFTAAIDQLLSYTVWRDTKAALILFIRNSEVSSVIEAADNVIRQHPNFVSAANPREAESRMDYLLHAADDSARNIRLALLPVILREPQLQSDS